MIWKISLIQFGCPNPIIRILIIWFEPMCAYTKRAWIGLNWIKSCLFWFEINRYFSLKIWFHDSVNHLQTVYKLSICTTLIYYGYEEKLIGCAFSAYQVAGWEREEQPFSEGRDMWCAAAQPSWRSWSHLERHE